MKFTQLNNKKVEEYIREKINIISKTICKRIPDTVSIVMSGGFGKEEGSVVIKKNKIILINDFDMYIITKKKHSEEEINNVAQEAARKIDKAGISSFVFFDKDRPPLEDFFYIDLKAIPINDLKKLPFMVKFYELRNSSKVVFGSNVLNKIPNFGVKDIPLAEGARFLLNRMSHLVQHFYPSFFTKDVKDNHHQVFLLHTIKTYTDACTALLILSRNYKPTYSKRFEIFKDTFSRDFSGLERLIPNYVKKIKEFTNLKLKFDLDAYKGKDLELWKQSRDYIGISTKYFFGRFLNKDINDYYDLSNAINKSAIKYYSPYIKRKFNISNKLLLSISSIAAHIYMNFLYFNRMRQYHKKLYFRSLFRLKPPELTFFSALPLILYSLKDDGSVDLKMLEDGKKILQKVYPVNVKYKDNDLRYWEDVADVYSNAYILFAFLKLK